MAIRKEKKEAIIGEVTDALKGANSAVFVNFHGLTVAEGTELRRLLRAEGARYGVVKKTLMRRALAEAGITGEQPSFDGEFGFAWSEDLIAPARVVYGFVKTHEGHLALQGGIFEGRYKNAAEMEVIARIPSRETLIAQVVQLINSPLSGLVIALNQVAEKK